MATVRVLNASAGDVGGVYNCRATEVVMMASVATGVNGLTVMAGADGLMVVATADGLTVAAGSAQRAPKTTWSLIPDCYGVSCCVGSMEARREG